MNSLQRRIKIQLLILIFSLSPFVRPHAGFTQTEGVAVAPKSLTSIGKIRTVGELRKQLSLKTSGRFATYFEQKLKPFDRQQINVQTNESGRIVARSGPSIVTINLTETSDEFLINGKRVAFDWGGDPEIEMSKISEVLPKSASTSSFLFHSQFASSAMTFFNAAIWPENAEAVSLAPLLVVGAGLVVLAANYMKCSQIEVAAASCKKFGDIEKLDSDSLSEATKDKLLSERIETYFKLLESSSFMCSKLDDLKACVQNRTSASPNTAFRERVTAPAKGTGKPDSRTGVVN